MEDELHANDWEEEVKIWVKDELWVEEWWAEFDSLVEDNFKGDD